MVKIEITIEQVSDTLILDVFGLVDADDIIAFVEGLRSDQVKKNHLWDLTYADLYQLDRIGFTRIARAFSKYDDVREGGTTMIVASSEVEAILLKLYSSVSENLLNRSIVFHIAGSKDEAIAWSMNRGALANPLNSKS